MASPKMQEAAVSGGFRIPVLAKFSSASSEISWNVLLSLEPMALTLAMITTEMPAAMRPYSIAVAPVSSLRNATSFDMWSLQVHLCSAETSVTPLNGTFLCCSNSQESVYRALGKRPGQARAHRPKETKKKPL